MVCQLNPAHHVNKQVLHGAFTYEMKGVVKSVDLLRIEDGHTLFATRDPIDLSRDFTPRRRTRVVEVDIEATLNAFPEHLGEEKLGEAAQHQYIAGEFVGNDLSLQVKS